jgi:nicotinamidase-related amidase
LKINGNKMETNFQKAIVSSLAQQSQPFLAYLEDWLASLPTLSLKQAFPNPDLSAILSVDLVQGFCTVGPLASPRVNAVVTPVTRLMQSAWNAGVQNILLSQDTHEPDAVEFGAWPPHCVRDTSESEAVDEIKQLPFYNQLPTFPKNSINSLANTGLAAWLESNSDVNTFVVVGDCTDLCVHQLAMQLLTHANAYQIQRRVIVPVNCVDTYDRSIEDARAFGGFPHPGELLHATFLYHMALNGVEVVRSVE